MITCDWNISVASSADALGELNSSSKQQHDNYYTEWSCGMAMTCSLAADSDVKNGSNDSHLVKASLKLSLGRDFRLRAL